MKLDAVKFGLACGIVWAGGVLCLAVLDVWFNWGTGMLKGLSSLYLGYKATPSGAAIGMLWAFCDAGIGGWLVAAIYNLLVGKK
ncbi:MAG: bacteriophage holin [Candidatus Margulisiibacteriota bacterium]